MPDDITVDNGALTDYTVATDEVGSREYQIVKLADGAADSEARIGGDAANGLDVDVTRVQGTVTVSGTVTSTPSGTQTVDSELPAAAALADNTANPTAPAVGAFGMAWDGSTWDRVPGTAADGILVNLGANNDITLSEPISVDDNGGSLTVDGTITANAGTGTFTTQEEQAGTATLANVSGSASSVQLLAANAARVQAVIYNDSTAILYVKYGTTASATDFTWKLYPDDSVVIDRYTGRIDGIWASATGAARVTEL